MDIAARKTRGVLMKTGLIVLLLLAATGFYFGFSGWHTTQDELLTQLSSSDKEVVKDACLQLVDDPSHLQEFAIRENVLRILRNPDELVRGSAELVVSQNKDLFVPDLAELLAGDDLS
ncbi:MAG: hypothetical protein R3C03_13730 [Pirellulaceae bacterium]